MIDVIMPQMGESIVEGTLTKWLKKPGDTVERDEPLFEISTDKVDAEIPSPAAGVLSEIKVQAGATVQISSSRVLPCTCEPSTSRPRPRLRYFQTKTTSVVSTITKTAAVNPKMR